jgi:thioredoxin-related protein
MHNYDEALAKAKVENKKLLVLITTQTCRWCRKLESTTFKDSSIIKRVNEKYIAVALTRDKDSYPSHFKAKMVPMSYFLHNSGKVINSVPGYWGAEDYHTILDDVNYELKKQDTK